MHVVVKTWPSATVQSQNAFDGLEVEECDIGEQLLPDNVVSVLVVAPESDVSNEKVGEAKQKLCGVAVGQGLCGSQGEVQHERILEVHAQGGSVKPQGSNCVRRAPSPRTAEHTKRMHVDPGKQ